MKREKLLRDGEILTITEARAENAEEIDRYVQTVCAETEFFTFGPGEFNITSEENKPFLEAQYAGQNTCYFLARIGGELVATLSFSGGHRPRIQHTGTLGMSVLRAHWGRGVGAALLATLLEWARSTGVITKVNLEVRADNARAIALYQRMGFVKEGLLVDAIRVNGVSFNNWRMGLRLESGAGEMHR